MCAHHPMELPAGDRDLPRRDHQREVPWGDERTYPHRLAKGHVEPGILDRYGLAEDLVGRPAPVLEGIGHDPDLVFSVPDRFPGVATLEPREVLLALPH